MQIVGMKKAECFGYAEASGLLCHYTLDTLLTDRTQEEKQLQHKQIKRIDAKNKIIYETPL